jgi:hypothetical protein
MGEWKGQRLFVNLSASQARRRLKGLGYGVRKVQSAGRNRALIIHTATGDHRRELEAIFQDARVDAPAADESPASVPGEQLRNMGSRSAS